jgi:acetyl-CoA carboxylase biotin carboxyl carrier protein
MELEYLERLVALLERSESLSELEIEEGGNRIRLAKAPPAQVAMPQYYSAPPAAVHSSAPAVPAAPAAAPAVPAGHEVRSPIVGTFYRSPTPDAAPFIEVGAHVKKGDLLCIVEAMKLMHDHQSARGEREAGGIQSAVVCYFHGVRLLFAGSRVPLFPRSLVHVA